MYTLLGATVPESQAGEGAMSEPLLHWIDGESVASVDGTTRTGTDPSTGGPGTAVSLGTAADVDRAVRAAHRARTAWRHLGSLDRGRILAAIGRRLLAELDALAAMETADTGKPLALSAAEIRGAAEYFEFYAALVNLPAGQVLDIQPNLHVYTLREPLGVIGVITPWNLPLNQVARACAPALAAGNTVVAKPAEATSRTTVELARMAAEEGLPPGVLNVVLGLGPEVGTAIVRHPLVRKVAFTGSVRVGQEIGRIAADRILPLTLELGGKSANIVFADADLDFAATEAVRAYATNAGQVCSSGTRLLVQRPVQDRFVEAVVAATGRLRPGRDVGPLITHDQWETVQRYFTIAEEEGARAEIGGTLALDPALTGGFYVEPTVYTARHQRHAHRPRGDLRTGARRHRFRHRGGSGGAGQRLRLRAGGRCLHRRHVAGHPGGRGDRGRPGVHQLVVNAVGADAVRRLQAQWLRPGEGH